ncbi:MAG: sigma-70 family RNA polymerase sigma factor [Sandaracinus sp.]|nr:sigma-70 family RNA polymerase sigma factor [Sandaracinus sp.]
MTTATLDAATIREMEPTLLRYARLRVGREDVARDLVQETWVAAFGGLSSFAGRSSLKTWLVSILRRKIVDMHRRSRPQVMFEEHHTPPADTRRERLDDEAAMDLVQSELEALPAASVRRSSWWTFRAWTATKRPTAWASVVARSA